MSLLTLQKNGNKLPDNKALATEFGGKSELKKYMKRVMPFAQVVKEKAETVGLSALNLTLDFNEFDVLESNKDYLKNTLDVSSLCVIDDSVDRIYIYVYIFTSFLCFTHNQLDEIIIKYTDEAPEKTKEECCPGAPYMSFSKKTAVPVHIVNPQSNSGLFEESISVSQADTASDIASRIAKHYKHIKGIYLLPNDT